MTNYLNWVTFDGQELLFCDLSGLQAEALVARLNDFKGEVNLLGKTDLLIIFDVSNSFIDREIFNEALDVAKVIKPLRKKSAFFGVKGGKKFLLNSLLSITKTGSQVKSFDDLDEAKRWLIS